MKKLVSLSILLTILGCGDGKSSNENNETNRILADTAAVPGSTPAVSAPASTPALTPEAPKPTEQSQIPIKPVEQSPVPVEGAAATQGAFAIAFDAQVNGKALKCYDKSAAMLAEGQVFTDLRMFISNLSLVSASGEEVKLSLNVTSESANLQFKDETSNTIALLNFLDSGCSGSDATKLLKDTISGVLPYGNYTAVKFQVGLPYPSMDSALTLIPAALAPTDMAWMWEHYPADFQIETYQGSTRKIMNALTSATKTTVTLPVAFTHASDAKAPSVQLELSKLFATSAEDFAKGIERACVNSNKPVTEASPNCAHAFKALGLPVLNPKAAYDQSVFTIAP